MVISLKSCFTIGVNIPDTNQMKTTMHIAMGASCGVILAVVGIIIVVVVAIQLRKSKSQHGGCLKQLVM